MTFNEAWYVLSHSKMTEKAHMPDTEDAKNRQTAGRSGRYGARRKERAAAAFFAALAGLLYMAPAHAYLDPGTGSIILQSMLAGLAIVLTSIGMFWQRIKLFFSSLFSSAKPDASDKIAARTPDQKD